MFRQSITTTPLTNEIANGFFANIGGDAYRSDNSFVASLRALIHKRMPKEDTLTVRFGGSSISKSAVNGGDEDTVRSICETMPMNPGTLYIHDIYGDEESINANFELIEQKFESAYEGWSHLEKIKVFYSRSFKVLCFVNPEIKHTVIFTAKMDNRKLHYLQCSIFAVLPWYFNPDDGISDLEMALVYSLREKTSEPYIKAITALSETFDLRQFRIKHLLEGFEVKYERRERDKLKREIEALTANINDFNRRIGEIFKQKNDLCTRLLGLELKIGQNDGVSDIMDYFMCNRRLVLESVTDDYMYFSVKDYLTYFDEDAAKRMIKNKNSYVYDGMSRYMEKDKMEKFMNAVFVDQILKIRVCASYRFSLSGNVQPNQYHSFDSEFEGYLPNTHIDRYGCMGNYSSAINQLLRDNDYIGALEQSIASCKSINFGDSTVMREFMAILYGHNTSYSNKCVELPDGSVVTPAEAVEWLEALKTE